jgi:hypothetical protein
VTAGSNTGEILHSQRLIGTPVASSAIMRFVVITGIGWLPLAITALVEQLLYGQPEALLRDPAVHVRALVATPLFALAALLLQRRTRERLAALDTARLAPANAVDRLGSRARAVHDSLTIDLLALTSAVVIGQLLFWRVIKAPFDVSSVAGGPATWIYGCVTFPLFLFLALRFALHWLIWAALLFALARLPLLPDAAHPDRAGGLGLLLTPTVAFAPFSFGFVCVASATWTRDILAGRVHLPALIAPGAVLIVAMLVFAFAPLFVFVPLLIRARRNALQDYGILAARYVREFRSRWLQPATPAELLGTGDLQSLADLGNSFRFVEQTRFVPFGVRDLLAFAIVLLVPFAPVVLTEVPVHSLLLGIGKLVVGH